MIFTSLLRLTIITLGLALFWQAMVVIFNLQPYILPQPWKVLLTLISNISVISQEALTTLLETLLGFILATLLGCITAIALVFFRLISYWLLPLLIISQALPTFAIAPLFVIWFGYGLSSKVATTVLMLFFPIASSFYDGLKQTNRAWLDLAQTMNPSKWRLFWHLRIPAALPALASGLRMAAAIAPIGAIVGEWVGSSHGLGYLMLNANARMQIDFMFATLLIVILLSLLFYFTVDGLLHLLIPWQENKEGN